MPKDTTRPRQRDDMDIVRMIAPGPQLRAADDGTKSYGSMPTMVGHFTRFDEWTEIDSYWEGRFLERIAKGAAKKTIKERGDKIRSLFQHGRDPQIGSKPLGVFDVLREDDEGVYYEVPLFDTSYNRDLIPGLESGAYGASFRFRSVVEEWNDEPGASEHNPDGIPERTIKELQLFEGGPVTFPAYDSATAGIRSLTDHFVFADMTHDVERLKEMAAFVDRISERAAAHDDEPDDEARAKVDAADSELRAAFETGDPDAIVAAANVLKEARAALHDTTSTAETKDAAGAAPHGDEHARSTDGAGERTHARRERRGTRNQPRWGLSRRSEPWRIQSQ